MFQLFFNKVDDYYTLTTGGYAAFIVLILLILVLSAFIGNLRSKNTAAKKMPVKQLVFCAAALALGFIASYITLYKMPWGGSVTMFSMLFICLIGYWYGPKVGLMTGIAYGILQFIQDGGGYIISPLQIGFDYIFAFAALGLSGLFSNSKNGLLKGYITGILFRGVFHSIGGYLYWLSYMPDSFPKALAPVYPIIYNYSYILIEGVVTIIILTLPPVASAMKQVKKMAVDI